MRITAIVHATRKRCDRAKSTTRLGLRVSLYGQMLTSEIRTELASTHMNVDNVCELTSQRLRTDQRRLQNHRWRNDRHSAAHIPTTCLSSLQHSRGRSPTERSQLQGRLLNGSSEFSN